MDNDKVELIRNHKKIVKEPPTPAALICISVFASLLECIRKDNARQLGLLTWKMQ